MVSKWGKSKISGKVVWGAVLAVLSAASAVAYVFFQAEDIVAYAAIGFALIAAILDIAVFAEDKAERRATARKFNLLKSSAFVNFDEKNGKASIIGAFSELTGIETGSEVIDREKYFAVMEEIISGRHATEKDVYMSVAADKWIKVVSNKTDGCEFTEITDVSDYISSKNTISSLKNYDISTGLMTKETFVSKLMETASASAGMYGLINIAINGTDKFSSFAGIRNADELLSRAAAIIKRYENPHNIFAGIASASDFCVLVTDTYDDGCRKIAEKITSEIREMIAELSGNGSIVKVYCGYVLAVGNTDASVVISQADFAAFDAENRKSQQPVMFSADNYSLKAQEFRKNQVFERIIGDDMIDYHFQPIVDARTGEIYGYEALMRPQAIDGVKLSPLDVLDIAKDMDMLYSIEHITFWKTLRILSENQDFFHNRKLFVNCIPNALLSNEEYEELADKYGMLFDKLVIEVTEENPVFDSAINIINERYRSKKVQIALDDYGTGYSNDSTLLSVKPSVIKIDRSIMSGIDKDSQKQHLVANMINFAAQHEIMVLGEGVETFEELETAISLGVDLIQGYVACRPTAVLMLEIPSEIKNRIISYNMKYRGKVSKIYYVSEHETADIVALALAGFNEIWVKSESANIIGNYDVPVDMKITIDSVSSSSRIRFENINLVCNEEGGCSVYVKHGVHLNVELVGSNFIRDGGIRIPGDSECFFGGEGSLEITNSRQYSFGIGGNYMQRYGRIVFGNKGNIKLICSGDCVIGIGGADGGHESAILVNSGRVSVNVNGKKIIAIGSYSGDSSIRLYDSDIAVTMGGDDVVAIGSRIGKTAISTHANLDINISGNNCVGLGVLQKGEGSVIVDGTKVDILVRGKNVVGIGTTEGELETVINAGIVNVHCEGNAATAIGDMEGGGAVRLRGATISAVAKAGVENPIGLKNGRIYVTSGSIETSNVEPLECYSLADERLVRVEADGTVDFRKTVHSGGDSYIYLAQKTGAEKMYLYLPESEIKEA